MRSRTVRGWLHHRAMPGERLAPAAGADMVLVSGLVNQAV